jgi:hypothetical protein
MTTSCVVVANAAIETVSTEMTMAQNKEADCLNRHMFRIAKELEMRNVLKEELIL